MARAISSDFFKDYIVFDFMYDSDDLDSRIKKMREDSSNYDGMCAKCYPEPSGNSLTLVMDRQLSNSDVFKAFALNAGSEGYVLVYDYNNNKAVLYTVLNEYTGQSMYIRFHINGVREIPL